MMRVLCRTKRLADQSPTARGRFSLTRVFRAGLIGLVLLGTLVNVWQFRNPSNGIAYGALLRWPTVSILENLNEELDQANGLYLSLAKVAPGSRLVFSSTGELAAAQIRNKALTFGAASTVRSASFQEQVVIVSGADAATGLPLSAHVQAAGEMNISVGGITMPSLWAIVTGACEIPVNGDQAPEFAVLRVIDHSPPTLLLIETCLLPLRAVKAL